MYKEVSSRYSIPWELLEAVHQVESGKSTGGTKSSYAGAQGPFQFLPSTFRHYAGDGADINDLSDSMNAAASLLSSSGASSGDIDSALFSYNHSSSYVALVKSVMNSIK
jgi:membrane-bound lytic murein transglycosylase B